MALVLVADDIASIRRLFRYALPEHDVIEAANGDEALDLLVQRRPDIAFLDVMMAGMTGDAVCRAARSDPRLAATTLVLMSAHAHPEVDLQLADAGADAFLRKPFVVSQVRALVDACSASE